MGGKSRRIRAGRSAAARDALRRFTTGLLLLCVLSACSAQPGGVVHVVERGENLYRIGKAYGVPYQELARHNRISDPSRIEVGQEIAIPGATRRLPVEIITPRYASREPISIPDVAPGSHLLQWPTRTGTLSSRFGPRSGAFHDGVDIAAAEGTPIYAARGGRVIYSDHIPGYGNIVIVDHGQQLSTVYAHNSKNEVREGEAVEAGQILATVGRTGRTTGANLHFEVRQGNVAKDPLAFLPPLP